LRRFSSGNIPSQAVSNEIRTHSLANAPLQERGALMFEDSLVESKSAPISPEKQWTTLGSIALQGTAAMLLIALPLLHPEHFPLRIDPPHFLLPLPPKPVVQVKPVAPSSASTSSSASTPPANTDSTVSTIPYPIIQNNSDDRPLAPVSTGQSMWTDTGLPNSLATADHGPAVSVAPAHPPTRINISGGVTAGMLLSPIRPVYPAIARAVHVEGTVVVEAVISRAGTIESLHVISGPEMLRRAALDAIQAARYKPYRLNGEPTEVQTTITVNFRLNG
jgi:protein TonB